MPCHAPQLATNKDISKSGKGSLSFFFLEEMQRRELANDAMQKILWHATRQASTAHDFFFAWLTSSKPPKSNRRKKNKTNE
jgi:hypothetical protein